MTDRQYSTGRQPIDPALRRFLDETTAPIPSVQPSTADRVRLGRHFMQKALDDRGGIRGLPNGVAVRDVTISGDMKGRLYLPPRTDEPLPVLVYAHGGGWVVGSIATHDPFCRLLSEAGNVIILSVEYRLAPEHPFPAGLTDIMATYHWSVAHCDSFGGDARRHALGGDSAGANLAAAAAQRLLQQGQAETLRAMMLLYPVTDHPSGVHRSYVENGVGYGLPSALMQWFWQQYAPDMPPDDSEISLLRAASVPAFPTTLIATAEYDPLRDEGIAYSEKLRAAGIVVTHLHAPDMHHNFPVHPGTVARFPQCTAALADFASWLTTTLR